MNDHDQRRQDVEEETLSAVESLRQRAREAIERTREARERSSAADHIQALLAQLEATVNELDGLRTAMSTRATIEQAKGVLMCLRGCGPDEAFQHLVTLSQVSQRKLHDVATLVVVEARNGRLALQTVLDPSAPASQSG